MTQSYPKTGKDQPFLFLPTFLTSDGVLQVVRKKFEDRFASALSRTGAVVETPTEFLEQVKENAASKRTSKDPDFLFLFLIEAHCSFDKMSAFIKWLQDTKFPENARGSIILVSDRFDSATPSLDSARDDDYSQSLLDNLRHCQFYIRMFEAYGWATFSNISRVDALIERLGQSPADYLKLDSISLKNWQEDVLRIEQELNKRLELGVWANTTTPIGRVWKPSPKRRKRFFPGVLENSLKSMALAHQFGRLDSPKAESIMQSSGIAWFMRDPYGDAYDGEFSPPHFRNRHQESTIESRDLWEDAPTGKRTKDTALHWELVQNAGTRNRHRANAFVFDLLCDLSQMLSKGTAPWASDSIRTNEANQKAESIRVLAVKDRIRGIAEQSFVEELFSSAFHAAFRPGTLEIDCADHIQGEDGSILNQPWDEHKWWLDRIEGRELVDVRHDAGSGERKKTSLLTYDIILIEAEFSNRFVGQSIVHWLDHMLDEVEAARNNGSTNQRARPQVFILSRDENAGHSFMCLWLGAQAYASKSRIFGIPALFTMANIRNRSRNPDRKRLRPNFYALEGLLPHQRNRLQSTEPRDLIIGDKWDRFWLQQLPKPDLHYHIGTSIGLDAVRALAANTAGYLFDSVELQTLLDRIDRPLNVKKEDEKDKDQATIALGLIENACKVALLYAIERQEFASTQEIDPYKHLYGSARYVLRPKDKDGKIVSRDAPDFNALDSVVHWLVPPDRPVRIHEACAAIVTAISVLECLEEGHFVEAKFARSVYANWALLDCAADCLSEENKDSVASSTAVVTHYLLDRISKNWKDLYSGGKIRVFWFTGKWNLPPHS